MHMFVTRYAVAKQHRPLLEPNLPCFANAAATQGTSAPCAVQHGPEHTQLMHLPQTLAHRGTLRAVELSSIRRKCMRLK